MVKKKRIKKNTLLSIGDEGLNQLDWLVDEIDGSTRTEIMRRLIYLAWKREDIREALHGGIPETQT